MTTDLSPSRSPNRADRSMSPEPRSQARSARSRAFGLAWALAAENSCLCSWRTDSQAIQNDPEQPVFCERMGGTLALPQLFRFIGCRANGIHQCAADHSLF